MDQSLQNWSAWATILGTVFTVVAVIIAIFDIKVSPQSRNFLKQLVTNRWFLFSVGVILFGFALWFQYSRAENLAKIVAQRETEIESAHTTQTAQAAEYANKLTSTPEIREVPVTVEVTREVTAVVTVEVEREVTVVVERQVTVLAPTHTPYPTYTSVPPPPTYTPYPEPILPTPIIQIVTATPEPTPTKPLGPILEEGEWWKTDKNWLRVSEVRFGSYSGGEIRVILELVNKSGGPIVFRWSADENFSLVDNTGHRYKPTGGNNERVETNGIIEISTHEYTDYFFNSSVTDMVFTVNDFPNISQVKWHVRVPK